MQYQRVGSCDIGQPMKPKPKVDKVDRKQKLVLNH